MQKAKSPKRGPGKAANRKAVLSAQQTIPYGDVTIPFVDRFPRGEIYNLLTTRPEDLKNEAKAE